MMRYLDFGNVYALSITIYSAYVIVTRTNEDVFYDFCRKIVDFHLSKILKTKTEHLANAESLKARLKNRLEHNSDNSNNLSSNAECVFKCAVDTLDKIKLIAESIVDDCPKKFKNLNYPKRLSVVAIISIFYSFYILIMAGFIGRDMDVLLNASLAIPNLIIISLVLYACVWDYYLVNYKQLSKWLNLIKPTYILYLIVIVLIIIFSILYIYIDCYSLRVITINDEKFLKCNYLISILACLSGFISYVIGTTIVTNKYTRKCSKEIKELHIPLMAKAITLMVNNYKNELDEVDDITKTPISASDFKNSSQS